MSCCSSQYLIDEIGGYGHNRNDVSMLCVLILFSLDSLGRLEVEASERQTIGAITATGRVSYDVYMLLSLPFMVC